MKNKFRVLCLATGLIFSPFSLATYSCSGPVSGVSVDNTGMLWAQSAAGISWLGMCNLTTAANGFDPSVCKAVHAQLLAAQAAGKNVTLYFNDTGSCTTHTAWQLPPTGFYFITVN